MLHNVRGDSYIPDGLQKAKVELTRGMLVSKVFNAATGEFEINLPTGADDVNIYGFVTLREDEAVYARSHYDTIEAGRRCQVNTLVKDHEWATDQVEGFDALAINDKVEGSATGALVKSADGVNAIGYVVGKRKALSGYEKDTVIVHLL